MDQPRLVHSLFGDHMVLQRGCPIPVWGKAIANEIILVKLGPWCYETRARADGSWMVAFDRLEAGGPYDLQVSSRSTTHKYQDVYIGEVWLCSGQSNMDQRVAKGNLYWCGVSNEEVEIAEADYPLIRLYSTRLQLSDFACTEPADAMTQLTNPYTPGYSGEWTVCSTHSVGTFSATAYFFGRELFKATKLPIGLIVSCYGASTAEAWISREALEVNPELGGLFDDYLRRCTQYEDGSTKKLYKAALRRWLTLAQEYRDHPDPQSNLLPPRPSPPRNPRIDQHSPTLLYNGMIAPLVPYAIRGVVWYHGDSNGSTANKYYLLLKTMIEDWRARWGLDLTVLIVQCANINSPEPYPVSHGSVPIIREAQLLASMLPNVGLAVTIDIGERDSHPRNKQEVGRRLSLLARHMTYKECIPCQGPIYESMKMERREIRLFFRNAEGLTSIGPLNAFAVAGPEGNFVRGEAIIDGETVVVSSNSIAIPVAVRYGWSDNPSTALYNKHGLPAPPFRTDQYPIV